MTASPASLATVGDERAALYGAGGALLGVMRATLDGQAPADADVHHAEGVLRLLGLTHDGRRRGRAPAAAAARTEFNSHS